MYSLSTAMAMAWSALRIAAFFVSTMHARVFWFSIFLSTCLPALLAKTPAKEPVGREQ